jgi:hypothetical protein
MKTQVLRGSKEEIAETLVRLSGEVREAIVFLEETPSETSAVEFPVGEDLFAEMRPFMVDIADADDSRAAIYSRVAGE